jgi:hypothetical protein
MQNSKDNLDKKQNKKASKSQKNAANKMQKMSKKMKDMAEEMQAKEHEEDYQALRQILENLVYVSLEQEDLMNEFKTTMQYNPHYVELARKQQKLKDDAKLIEDSLHALSKRVMEIKSFVDKEIGKVNFNMDNAVQDLGARNTPQARNHQQFAMTSLNNLALMLSEVMQNMQEQMQQDKESQGSMKCNKPKKKPGPSMKKMEELQKEVSEQIKKMKEGQKQGKGGQQLSKELSETAARQEAIRRQLQKMEEDMKKNGKSTGDMDQIQKLMDKNETDIVNKRITEETIKRQEEIRVRMLESEKAEKQQEMDEQRESHTSQNKNNPNPPLLEKYLQMKQKEVELLHTVPPGLNPYYREKVKTYFQDLKN